MTSVKKYLQQYNYIDTTNSKYANEIYEISLFTNRAPSVEIEYDQVSGCKLRFLRD
jgi:hypothetical protein